MDRVGSLLRSLVEVDDSLLIVIDVQDYFLARLAAAERERLVRRIGWLIDAAVRLGVPVVATAEELERLGGVSAAVADKLPPGCAVFDKPVFGLAADEAILRTVEETGRRTAVLVGLETDVCVAHSALGLLARGWQVAVPVDAVAAPGLGHEVGLERLRRAGALVTSVKSLYYEWVRTVAQDAAFFAAEGVEPIKTVATG